MTDENARIRDALTDAVLDSFDDRVMLGVETRLRSAIADPTSVPDAAQARREDLRHIILDVLVPAILPPAGGAS